MARTTAELIAEALTGKPSPEIQDALSELRMIAVTRQQFKDDTARLALETADACRRALELGLTPTQIAEAVGVTRQQVDLYRTGKTGHESRGKK